MTALICPNAWHVQQFFTSDEDTWSNVFGADVGALVNLTQANSDSLTDAIQDAWNDHLKALVDASVTLDKIVVTDVRTEGAPQFFKSYATAGTATGDRLPDELAVVLTLRTGLRTKAGRGRMYLAGFAEGSNAGGGVIDSATVTAVEDYGAQLKSSMAGLSWDLGVISRHAPAFGTTGTIRPVTALEVRNNVWKSQRRRRRTT